MDCLIMHLTIIGAIDLKDVNHLSKMEVTVAGSLEGDQGCTQNFKSPVDVRHRRSPEWSYYVGKLYVDKTSAREGRLIIRFKLFSRRMLSMLGENYIGEVVVSIKELLDDAGANGEAREVIKDVRLKSGNLEGKLVFSYKFVEVANGEAREVPGHADLAPPPVHPNQPEQQPPPPVHPNQPAQQPPNVGNYILGLQAADLVASTGLGLLDALGGN